MSKTVNNIANTIKLYNSHSAFFYILPYNIINDSNSVNTLINNLSDSDLVNNILRKSLFNDASDYVVSLQLYPIANLKSLLARDGVQLTGVQLGKKTSSSDIGTTGWATGYLANKGDNINSSINNIGIIDMGSYTFNETFNNFLDYAPFTKIELYLPYAEIIELDTNQVMGKTINIKYVINWLTGAFTWYIECDSAVIQSGTSQLSINIPIGSTNAQEIARNKLNGIIQGASSLFTLGASAYASNLFLATRGVRQGFESLKNLTGIERYSRSKFNGEIGGWYGSQNPYLIITRKQINNIDYTTIKGRPCNKTLTLSNLSGMSFISECRLVSKTATTEDIEEINSLLSNGVIF